MRKSALRLLCCSEIRTFVENIPWYIIRPYILSNRNKISRRSGKLLNLSEVFDVAIAIAKEHYAEQI